MMIYIKKPIIIIITVLLWWVLPIIIRAMSKSKRATRKSEVLQSPSANYEMDEYENSGLQAKLDAEVAKRESLEKRMRDIIIESKYRLEASFEEIKSDFNSKIDEISADMQELYRSDGNCQVTGRKKGFTRKEFRPRVSLLSKMLHYDDENYKTIMNIMIVGLVLWGSSLAFEDIGRSGLPNFDLLQWGIIRDLQPFGQYWILLFFQSYLVIFLGHFAAESRAKSSRTLYTALYTALQFAGYAFSAYVVNYHTPRFAMPMAAGLMCEQARMSMKMHSYFREKIMWKRFDCKFSRQPVSTTRHTFLFFAEIAVPDVKYISEEINKFTLFMFMPTLVYRDTYPRTSHIRWDFVFFRCLEFVAIVYYAFLLFRTILPALEESANMPITLHDTIRLSFHSM
jgi:hypothetical protein